MLKFFGHFYEKNYTFLLRLFFQERTRECIFEKLDLPCFYLRCLRENVWYKTKFESSRTVYDLRISFTSHLACRSDERLCLPFHLLKIAGLCSRIPCPWIRKYRSTVAPLFVLLVSMRAMDIVKLVSVPKSSLVSTYSFLTIMDCAIQERFQGNHRQSLGNGFNWGAKNTDNQLLRHLKISWWINQLL